MRLSPIEDVRNRNGPVTSVNSQPFLESFDIGNKVQVMIEDLRVEEIDRRRAGIFGLGTDQILILVMLDGFQQGLVRVCVLLGLGIRKDLHHSFFKREMKHQLFEKVFQEVMQNMPAILGLDCRLQGIQGLFDFFVLRIKFDNAEFVFLIHRHLPMLRLSY